MLHRRIFITAFAALLASCSSGTTAGPDAGSARVIFVHAITDTGDVDLRVASRLTAPFTAIPYGAGTTYQSVTSGSLTFSVQPSPSASADVPRPIANLSGIIVQSGASLTLVAAGLAKDTVTRPAALTAFVDDASVPASGQARLRIINASADAGAVDVYATPASGVQSAVPTFAGVDFRSALTRSVTAGTYTLTVTPLSEPGTILTQTSVTLPAASAQTVIVRGLAGALPPGTPASRRIATTVTTNVSP